MFTHYRARLELIATCAAVILAYLWLQSPVLAPLSLQAFASSILVFFFLKYSSRARSEKAKTHQRWRWLPDPHSLEVIPLTFAVLVLIGSTGNIESPYFMIGTAHLFLLVMSTKVETVIAATALIVLFHYGLTPGNQPIRWIDLATIPGISIFFLYIKNQIMASRMQAHHLQRSERHLATAQARSETIEQFISTFLLPKLEGLLQLGSVQETGKRTIVNQIDLLRSEAEKILIDRENTKN